MDIQNEINRLVKHAIMEEINNLAVRATIREKIEATGISHDEIRKIVKDVADSYFRSAMDGDVVRRIQKIFDQKVEEAVSREIKKVVGECNSYYGSSEVRKVILEEVERQMRIGYKINVSVTPEED